MKKLFALFLSIFACLLLVGCSELSKIVSEVQKNTEGNVTSETGKVNNGGSTAKASNNNKDQMKTRDEVAALIGEKYLITVRVDSSYRDSNGQTVEEYVTYTTVSDGVYSYWGTSLDNLANGSLYKRVNADLVSYDYSEEAGGYNSMSVFPTEINPFRSVNIIFFSELELEYTSKSSTTFLGRACTKYEYKEANASAAGAATYERTWIVDDNTGACLKYSAAVTGSGLGVNGGASGNFEVTEFVQGSSVDVTIKKITDKIFVKEWDTSALEKLGLSAKDGYMLDIYSICRANNIDSSKLQLREVSSEVFADTGNGEHSTQYFAQLSQSEGEKLVKAIITNLFNCGAKYDSDGTLCTNPLGEPLCYIETEGALAYSFSAWPGAGDPYVELQGEWNPYINNGVWSITLFVYYNNNK